MPKVPSLDLLEMITRIKINGFKSFNNFEMEFAPFTVIAGTNASGKSNLFDALKLIGRLADTDNLKKAFKEQRGEFIELFTQFDEETFATEISFEVDMLLNNTIKDAWGSIAKLKYTRLSYKLIIGRKPNEMRMDDLFVKYEHLETIKQENEQWIKIIPKDKIEIWKPKVITGKRQVPYIRTIQENEIDTVEVPQDGVGGAKRRYPLLNATRTVLSSFDTVDFPHVLAAKEEMKSWRFLELNPEDLRLPTQKNIAEDSLTQSGKNLAALLHRIKQEEPYHLKLILRKLQTFLPDFIELSVIDDNENKQYIIKLKDKDNREYSSRVLSEGTLRILALCILEYDHKHTGLLCFEEPENGIHPERVKNMVQLLKDLTTNFQNDEMPLRQVITNTHSPTFVAAIHKWEGCKEVELWFSEMRSRVIDKPKRMKINTTSISIVEKSNQTNLQFPYSKLNLVKLNEFLQITPSLS